MTIKVSIISVDDSNMEIVGSPRQITELLKILDHEGSSIRFDFFDLESEIGYKILNLLNESYGKIG